MLRRFFDCRGLAMECPSGSWRILRTLMPCFILATWFCPAHAEAQDEPSLETLLQRIERLERDNQQLREKVERVEESAAVPVAAAADDEFSDAQPRTRSSGLVTEGLIYRSTDPRVLFASSEGESLMNDSYVRTIVAQEIAGRDGTASMTAPAESNADSAQDKKIADLDQAFKSFQEKSSKKTYPNVTVNGVFQADAGWIHQDDASLARYGEIQDGSDFRRARLSAKGSVTELTNYFFQMDFGFSAGQRLLMCGLSRPKCLCLATSASDSGSSRLGSKLSAASGTRHSWNARSRFSRSRHSVILASASMTTRTT
jgi:hypothetical protein